jgi:hypothetical protein
MAAFDEADWVRDNHDKETYGLPIDVDVRDFNAFGIV